MRLLGQSGFLDVKFRRQTNIHELTHLGIIEKKVVFIDHKIIQMHCVNNQKHFYCVKGNF